MVGVSRQTIMQLERNRYNPSMLLAYSIAKVFDVTIEDLFDFWRDNKMESAVYNAIYNLLNTMEFVIGCKVLSVILFIIFCIYFFSKEGRDERGRAIIGTASMYSAIGLLISLNLVGLFTYTVMSDIKIFTSAICLVFLIFEMVELIAIAILRIIR